MSVIVILIGVSLCVAVGFLITFIWAVKSGQYQDNYTPSIRILFDEYDSNTKKGDKENSGLP
jgi:cbb3-type cytochrome oxidase maturation protein